MYDIYALKAPENKTLRGLPMATLTRVHFSCDNPGCGNDVDTETVKDVTWIFGPNAGETRQADLCGPCQEPLRAIYAFSRKRLHERAGEAKPRIRVKPQTPRPAVSNPLAPAEPPQVGMTVNAAAR